MLVLIASFVASIIFVILIAKNVSVVEHYLRAIGIIGPLISILLYGILSVTPIPSDPLSVINGAIFGPVWGSLISWMGNNLAAAVEYTIGKGVNVVTDFDNQKQKLPLGLNKFKPDSLWFLIGVRFLPQFGGKITSFVAGIYHVPLIKYLWTAAIANLVGSILFALGGYGLLQLL